MSESYSVITAPQVKLTVTSSINSFSSLRRFSKSLTIADLKCKLVMLTGATLNMTLELYKDKKFICNIDDDTALLGSYPVDDDLILHVTDTNVQCGEFESGNVEERYKISEDAYAKQKDSFRAFKEQNLRNMYQAKDQMEAKNQEEKEKEEEEKAATIKINDRCEVAVKNQPKRLGTVKYVGLTDFQSGYWVGVQYDEPVGKNDGSVKGKRYFECMMKYGGFVRPSNVTVGYYPEANELDEF